MSNTYERLPARTVLTATLLLSSLPIILIVVFPGKLDYVMPSAPYVLFHNISEFFSILVSLSIFGVGWFTFEQTKDRHSLLLSAAFLAIGLLDFMHVLSNAAMPAFVTPNSPNKSTQFWIAARLIQGFGFLACAVTYPKRYDARLTKKSLLAGALLVPGMICALVIFFPGHVPETFIHGQGLTPLKKFFEFLAVGLMCAALVAYRRLARKTDDPVLVYYQAALIISILGELNFAAYTKVFDSFNILGHLYKVAAFVLIYRGLFIASVREPYRRLGEVSVSRDELRKEMNERRQAEDALRKAHEELESRVEDRTNELREKDQMLMQQSRQAAMGEMIGNIAHQWRQPLNTLALIISTLPMLHERGQLSREELDTMEEKAMGIIQHMSRTIDDFRNYFKPDKERVTFLASEAVATTVHLIGDGFRNRGIGIEVVTGTNPSMNGYPNEFSQVLLNILLNARDAFSVRSIDGPRVVITLGKENGRAVVTVTDNAGGIPETIIDKIFDPYFTTKGPDQGTGLGLFMSKGIIEKNMGGRLTARNTGNGAEFRIEI